MGLVLSDEIINLLLQSKMFHPYRAFVDDDLLVRCASPIADFIRPFRAKITENE